MKRLLSLVLVLCMMITFVGCTGSSEEVEVTEPVAEESVEATEGGFVLPPKEEEVISYDESLVFTKENWLGRVLTCRGVGASLSAEKVAQFEREYRQVLDKYDEPLHLKHRIHIELYRAIHE